MSFEQIGYPELRALLADPATQLVEVLPAEEFDEHRLPGAINIPLKELTEARTADLDRTKAVVVYCWDGL
jgi:rhodanese-related sulfurtransferase